MSGPTNFEMESYTKEHQLCYCIFVLLVSSTLTSKFCLVLVLVDRQAYGRLDLVL